MHKEIKPSFLSKKKNIYKTLFFQTNQKVTTDLQGLCRMSRTLVHLGQGSPCPNSQAPVTTVFHPPADPESKVGVWGQSRATQKILAFLIHVGSEVGLNSWTGPGLVETASPHHHPHNSWRHSPGRRNLAFCHKMPMVPLSQQCLVSMCHAMQT